MNSKLLVKRMLRSKFFMIGFSVALLLILISLFAPAIVQYDPLENNLTERLQSPDWFSKGFSGHVLGTDELGRDVFSRLLIGGRYSLMIAAIVVCLETIIGTTLGVIAGYYGRVLNAVIMRLCDMFLAIPNMVIAIAIMAVLGPSTFNLVVVLTLYGWMSYCKITCNNVLVLKNQEFVSASRVLGGSNSHIMFTQILPNCTTQLLIIVSQQFGYTILVEAALSFLNMGIQPPMPSWGNMISNGRTYLAICPWLCFAPGIALMITVLAFNFLGDGLRDVLDPKRI